MAEEVVSKDRLVAEVLTIRLAPSQEVAIQPHRFDHPCLSRILQREVDAFIFHLRKIYVSYISSLYKSNLISYFQDGYVDRVF